MKINIHSVSRMLKTSIKENKKKKERKEYEMHFNYTYVYLFTMVERKSLNVFEFVSRSFSTY